jgi:phage portal protein BeeE
VGAVSSIIRAFRSSPARASDTSAAVAVNQGRIGQPNVRTYRAWSRGSTWVRAAINIRNDQIATAEWDIVPLDDTKRYSKRLQDQLRELFAEPNRTDGDFGTFVSKVNEDVLALDQGIIEKERSLDGVVRRIHASDGGDFKVNAKWDEDPRGIRYFWCPGGTWPPRDEFADRDIVHLMQNPRSDLPIGIPPLETLQGVIEDLLYGRDFQSRQVRGAAPDGLLDLGEGAGEKQINGFRNYWMSELAGKGAVGFIGGSKGAKFIPFRGSNRDMQFLEWNIWLVRQVAITFGLSAQDLSLTMDINRANAESETDRTEDKGLRPLMGKTQDFLTRGIVWDEGFGGKENNLAFRFTRLNLKESSEKAAINEKALGGAPWKTVDEARKDDGRAPIGGALGEQLLMKLANGVVVLEKDNMPTAREYLDLMAKKDDAAMGPPEEDGPPPEQPANETKQPVAPK